MKREAELMLGLLMVMLVLLISGNLPRLLGVSAEEKISYGPDLPAGRKVSEQVSPKEYVVVLDAGHGGMDAGKVGVNGCLEKELNLAIVSYLRDYLEANDVKVVLTRQTDDGLYSEDSVNRKTDDMNRRCEIIAEAHPDLVVSIHQNSYQKESVHGPQVFYYDGSKIGKALAQKLQKRFDDCVGAEENTRQIKPNTSYYLFKHVKEPIVIVECGFLSNSAEAERLCDPEYQKKVAWALHVGIMQQLQENK